MSDRTFNRLAGTATIAIVALCLVLPAAMVLGEDEPAGCDYTAESSSCGAELDEEGTVPKLTGVKASEARCRLADLGMSWRIDDGRVQTDPGDCTGDSAISPDPEVVRQRPRPGSAAGDETIVRLTTS